MKKGMVFVVLTMVICFTFINNGFADEIDQYTSYAVMLGRAGGCGMHTSPEASRVGKWFDRTFVPGTTRHSTHLMIMVQGIKYHAQQQASGKSPDSCSEVERNYKLFPWP